LRSRNSGLPKVELLGLSARAISQANTLFSFLSEIDELPTLFKPLGDRDKGFELNSLAKLIRNYFRQLFLHTKNRHRQ